MSVVPFVVVVKITAVIAPMVRDCCPFPQARLVGVLDQRPVCVAMQDVLAAIFGAVGVVKGDGSVGGLSLLDHVGNSTSSDTDYNNPPKPPICTAFPKSLQCATPTDYLAT